jgi:dTDP-4-dehydrorhamnose reductase
MSIASIDQKVSLRNGLDVEGVRPVSIVVLCSSSKPIGFLMMRILVTGTEGQVARALAERASSHRVDVALIGRPVLDLANPSGVRDAILQARCDIIVNAAAYTAVDQAENEPALAHTINEAGARAVAEAAHAAGVAVVQISTDYVFDGSSDRPYVESDPVRPLGEYGRSKLAGERAVAIANPNHVILRTAWVYSPYGKNFVKTMLRAGQDRDELTIVGDQHGAPTSALDIADGVVEVCRNLLARPHDPELRGVFHMTGTGYTTWAGFAERIFHTSAKFGGPTAQVRQITTAEYPTPAKRPANSRLDCSKLQAAYGITMPPWQLSLDDCVERLLRAR